MAAGLVVALAAGGALVTLGDRRSVSTAAALSEPEAKRFYADVKISLSPLLGHVAALPAALEQARLQPVPSGVAGAARAWADDAATARDLVGRLIPPASPLGLPIRSVYELGAAMFVESARALELAGESEDTRRSQAAASGSRLRLLSDRLFDGANRLLDRPTAGDASLILPAEVPDFEKEGLGPGAAAPAAAPGTGAADPSPATVPAVRWTLDHGSALAGTVRLMNETVPFDTLLGSRHRIPDWADQLRAISRELAGPVPASRLAREASFLLRLSLLTQSEALTVAGMATAQHDAPFSQAERLRLIADRLWNVAGELSETDGVNLGHALPETGIDPTILRRGGLFDGRPPPLARGDRPDSGVPGGLHLPDPSKVFSGR